MYTHTRTLLLQGGLRGRTQCRRSRKLQPPREYPTHSNRYYYAIKGSIFAFGITAERREDNGRFFINLLATCVRASVRPYTLWCTCVLPARRRWRRFTRRRTNRRKLNIIYRVAWLVNEKLCIVIIAFNIAARATLRGSAKPALMYARWNDGRSGETDFSGHDLPACYYWKLRDR